MNTLSIPSLPHYSSLSILTSSTLYRTSLFPQTFISSQTLGDDEIGGASIAVETEVLTRHEEFKWQRVERLCNEVKLFGEDIIDVDELASIHDFRIDKFQRLAIQAFLRGSSVVVSAPTNSNVGLLTGDSAVNKDAQVLIMTTEILRNMLYQSVGIISSDSGLFHVDVIVLDEVHYLSDISRGTVWEEIVIYCPKEVQLICLSATVANPDELAGWIGQIHGKTELVTSSKRPVPLTWHFSMKTSLLPLLDEKGTRMNRKLSLNYLQLNASGAKSYKDDGSRRRNSKGRGSDMSYDSSDITSGQPPLSKNDINNIRRSQVPQVIDTLYQLKARDMLPAIWFIFSRKGCDAAVQYVEDCKLLDECEMSEVELALKRFRIKYPDAVRETAVKGLLQGVAAHHAGCLPLWKSFIEELFQRGLVKVVFATETLAAGINMPARTAVISSLSKRSDSGRIQLRPNELLQMAGRAGRRGTDERGHVVLIQTPNEGAEECCKLLFAGIEPLVSQFTASYGMVLNLLAGAKIIGRSNESDGMKAIQEGRTLEEARKLVEQSFGNYVGSNVMLAAKEELTRIEKEIEMLTLEVDSLDGSKLKNMVSADDSFALNVVKTDSNVNDCQVNLDVEPSYYVALGSDNTWYVFTEKWIKTIYRTGFPNVALAQGDALPREIMRMLLDKEEMKWEKLTGSELGCLWRMEGSLETWSWSLNVPVLSSLSESDELLQMSEPYYDAVERYKEQRNKVARLKKKIARSKGFKEYKKIIDMTKFTEEKIKRLKTRSKRLTNRIEQIEPSGWKEFVQISNVIHETRTLDINTHVIFPLGETAAAIRGENELWLAMVLRNKILLNLKPAQLAAVCASLVSEGIKVRPWKNNSYIYEPSTTVINVINFLDEQRNSLLQLQEKHGVNISCCLDSQFSGMVEAWASGLTWREMMMDCAMDEGDLARLLRRTIDILAQIPKLPDIDTLLQSSAKAASNVMDRPPISELAG
ncbi:dexh-box atp-dependent rna helicase dexh15 chloroplastic [Quercus suber]|uniref:Dexh-box atp-dependent rna helicase dexh15 chloroplastic n=1 Tax=Quercus suber TaxID=58331 RepID=A0AAW0LAY2_QUESU